MMIIIGQIGTHINIQYKWAAINGLEGLSHLSFKDNKHIDLIFCIHIRLFAVKNDSKNRLCRTFMEPGATEAAVVLMVQCNTQNSVKD